MEDFLQENYKIIDFPLSVPTDKKWKNFPFLVSCIVYEIIYDLCVWDQSDFNSSYFLSRNSENFFIPNYPLYLNPKTSILGSDIQLKISVVIWFFPILNDN